MTTRNRIIAMALIFATLGLTAPPASHAGEDPATVRKLRDSGEIRPLEEISARAKEAKPGDILETELDRSGGRYIYEIEILDKDGRVWELELDASTAELLKMEIDD